MLVGVSLQVVCDEARLQQQLMQRVLRPRRPLGRREQTPQRQRLQLVELVLGPAQLHRFVEGEVLRLDGELEPPISSHGVLAIIIPDYPAANGEIDAHGLLF